MVRLQRYRLIAAGFAALVVPFLATHAARADGIFSRVPTIHVTIPTVENQAQLADRLRAQGFTQVVLSSIPASPANLRARLGTHSQRAILRVSSMTDAA